MRTDILNAAHYRRFGVTVLVLTLPSMAWAQASPAPAAAVASPSIGAGQSPSAGHTTVTLTPFELFDMADAASKRGDYRTAESAWRALMLNIDAELRIEARFRLAMMLANQQHKLREAAVLLRQILDEKPRAARVRIELARIQAQLGHAGSAARELRAAEATGLPPEVERAVRFYAQALDQQRRSGANFEVSLAPDSNVNRATASSTLNTTIGNLTLNPAARAQSGIGAIVRGQAFLRKPVSTRVNMLAQLSGSANVYRASAFDDFILSPQAGPELNLGQNRLSLTAGPAWRWYGAVPYSFSVAANTAWLHAVGKRGQLRMNASFASVTNRRDPLESGDVYSLSAGVDRAFSARFGGGVQLSAVRQTARDPGYATANGSVSVYLFREAGKTTIALNLSYSHLEADQRLLLFLNRRIDDDLAAVVTGTFRNIRFGSISPLLRLRAERNISNIQIYNYRKISAEIGIATAF
jgi:tetratricopeptide (TPR) repeat protein